MPFGRKSAKPKSFLNEAGLYDYAIKALGRHMRTQAELHRLLQQRAEPGEPGESAISTVIARLNQNLYLNDQSYAETYARLRQENEKFGQRRVRNDMRQKGLAPGLVDKTLNERYANINEEALARQHLERKRIAKPANEKETARVMRRLVAAGFSTSVIYKILRQWDVSDEALAALDNLAENPHEE
ncbi:MAG: regulatory protein RecX [Terracidiphilus sp.]